MFFNYKAFLFWKIRFSFNWFLQDLAIVVETTASVFRVTISGSLSIVTCRIQGEWALNANRKHRLHWVGVLRANSKHRLHCVSVLRANSKYRLHWVGVLSANSTHRLHWVDMLRANR